VVECKYPRGVYVQTPGIISGEDDVEPLLLASLLILLVLILMFRGGGG